MQRHLAINLRTLVIFNSPIHSHIENTHTHSLDNLTVSSGIERVTSKGLAHNTPASDTLNNSPMPGNVEHTHSYTHTLFLRKKYTDWSQCRATERKSKKIQEEKESG